MNKFNKDINDDNTSLSKSHSIWINILQTSKTCMFNILTTNILEIAV